MERRKSLVIIGNGMVSHRLCAALTAAEGRSRDFRITVFGEEPRPAYDRVNLTSYFDRDDPDALLLDRREWYAERGITLHTGDAVTGVDREARIVVTASGQSVGYDRLVFATGSRAHVPPIEGTDLPGVFVYRTIEDIGAIRAYAGQVRHATVLGGGLLGLEAANVLLSRGLETHVLQNAAGLMSRQLNEGGSEVLQRKLQALGLKIHLEKRTERIARNPAGELTLEFRDGGTLKTGMLVLAAGIRPRDEIAGSAGLRLGAGGGIIVDDRLRTDDPRIFAIGECALHRGHVHGLVAPGYAMADVLAKGLRGARRAKFDGDEPYTRLKLLGVEVSTFGDFLGSGHQVVFQDGESYRMLVIDGSRLAGAMVVGDWEQTAALQVAVRERRIFKPSDEREFVARGHLSLLEIGKGVADWPVGAVVCNCTNTTRGELTACVTRGCATVDSLAEATGASTVCGSCRPLLGELVGADGGEASYVPKGRRTLVFGALAAAALVLLLALAPPLPESSTVQSWYFKLTELWQLRLAKQISGFSLAGLSVIALLLPLRKRWRTFRFLNFGLWRAMHGVVGALCVAVLLLHTGLHLGENMNLWLMTCFLGLNAAGAVAGLTVAMEERFAGPTARLLRSLVTKAHIVFFWPYPVLLGFHIFKVYFY